MLTCSNKEIIMCNAFSDAKYRVKIGISASLNVLLVLSTG